MPLSGDIPPALCATWRTTITCFTLLQIASGQPTHCSWTSCFSSRCPSGTLEKSTQPCGYFLPQRRLCCDRAQEAMQRWAQGAAQAEAGGEDACFNRCPEHALCVASTLRCECDPGWEWTNGQCTRPSRLSERKESFQNRRIGQPDDATNSGSSGGMLMWFISVASILQIGLLVLLCTQRR
ncbi:hypothetical protein CYMTET_38132 [Cymbomonas tetramitiformis]|uniref:EGF-like domain-containing protein n=1 Tax=Cymbomonas tetramitiformis TaxID=36881 RepID=A0AAE0F5I3_9CHLO|nr:hypothetical protein CYMTET_38132 [Cymbomonas tetramitiformis]